MTWWPAVFLEGPSSRSKREEIRFEQFVKHRRRLLKGECSRKASGRDRGVFHSCRPALSWGKSPKQTKLSRRVR